MGGVASHVYFTFSFIANTEASLHSGRSIYSIAIAMLAITSFRDSYTGQQL